VAYVTHMTGILHPEALDRAFAALRARYPVLAAHLEPARDGTANLVRPHGPLPGVSRGPAYADRVSQRAADDPLKGADADQGVALGMLHVRSTQPPGGAHSDDVHYAYSVNLRPRLNPPIRPTAGTVVLGTAVFRACGSPDPLTLADQVTARLRNDLRDGTLHRSAVTSSDAFVDAVQAGCVSASNWGPVPELPNLPGLTFDAFRSASCYDRTGIIDIFGEVDDRIFVIHSFQGRLTLELWLLPGRRAQTAQRALTLTVDHLLGLLDL
jgi:hypothetical protein